MLGVLFLIICGIIGIFIVAQNMLASAAIDTEHARIDAKVAEEEVTRLTQLRNKLREERSTIDKTAQIVADSQSYAYQDQVIRDLTAYATDAKIAIIAIDFGAKPGDTPAAGKTADSPVKRTIVSVQLDNNIPYSALLTFMRSIEKNVSKMQLTGINFQPKKDNPNLILGSTLEIEVFLR